MEAAAEVSLHLELRKQLPNARINVYNYSQIGVIVLVLWSSSVWSPWSRRSSL